MGWVDPRVGLGWGGSSWVEILQFLLEWVGFGRIWQKYYIFWWLYNIQLQGVVQVKYKGVWKIGVFRPISRFNSKTVQDTTIVSYTGRPSINCRQFCCYLYLVGLGWIHIFRFAMGWVGLGHSVDGLGWVGSGHRKWTHEQPWNKFTSEHLSYDSFGQVGVINVLNKENIRRIKITIKRFIQKNK